MRHREAHRIQHVGWLRASVLGANDGIVEKTVRIQEDHVQILKRDDGSTKNVSLIDKKNIHNNRLQVINQYEAEGARATTRKFAQPSSVPSIPALACATRRT